MKGSKTLFWVVGGVAAVALSAFAVMKVQSYLIEREQDELDENENRIRRYEDYVHSNGDRKRKPRAARRSQITDLA